MIVFACTVNSRFDLLHSTGMSYSISEESERVTRFLLIDCDIVDEIVIVTSEIDFCLMFS